MDKKNIIGIIIVILLGTIIAAAKNNNQQANINVINKTTNDTQQSSDIKNSADRIEVYYFHRTRRCYSCSTLGRYIRETIEQKFSEEIKNGKIDFREINVDLPENKEVAIKFQAGGSSLFINTIKDGQDNISQDTNIWRLLNDETQFKNYLENRINLLLGE